MKFRRRNRQAQSPPLVSPGVSANWLVQPPPGVYSASLHTGFPTDATTALTTLISDFIVVNPPTRISEQEYDWGKIVFPAGSAQGTASSVVTWGPNQNFIHRSVLDPRAIVGNADSLSINLKYSIEPGMIFLYGDLLKSPEDDKKIEKEFEALRRKLVKQYSA